jgi:ligand-binding sensor domain-containing protein
LNNQDLTSQITAVAALTDTLVVATVDGRILWRPGGEDTWYTEIGVSQLGIILEMAPDAGGVWIGGELGIGFLQLSNRAFRFFNAPRDLPGPVRDLLVTDDDVWVATGGGVVKFSKRGLR